ncbi:MAG: helix-turn-helix transcriptional regulator [Gammaproteobacteria bacterium]|nr:helix-turn-helix transcriptional regulator [Gammaproteobacteria bacterium]MBI5616683.1 helix-turn-helix transcriptional regulator [Gammaproteobacteria bacterium]
MRRSRHATLRAAGDDAREDLRRARQRLLFVGPKADSDASPPRRSPLSARELDVLNLITKGNTYDEIAGLLQITRNTVMTFVRRIYTKLEVTLRDRNGLRVRVACRAVGCHSHPRGDRCGDSSAKSGGVRGALDACPSSAHPGTPRCSIRHCALPADARAQRSRT